VAALVGRDYLPPARDQPPQVDEIIDPATDAMEHDRVRPGALDQNVQRIASRLPDQPRDEFVNSKPNRPLMQRWPSVTEESIGEVTFTMVSSWAWSVTAQPTPQ
jgi:hypothetical protein